MKRPSVLTAVLAVLLLILPSVTSPQDPTEPKSPPLEEPQRTMSLDFRDADIREVVRAVSTKFDLNIVIDRNVEGTVTVHLKSVPVVDGLRMLLEANGFTMEKVGEIYRVTKAEKERRMEVEATAETLTLEVKNAEIQEVLKEISKQSGLNIVCDQTVKGEMSGTLTSVPLEDGLKALLSANGFILSKRSDIYGVTRAAGQSRGRKGLSVTVKEKKLITLDVSGADLGNLLDEIASQSGLNIVRYGDVKGPINARLDDIPLDEALSLILQGTSYAYRKVDDIYLIGNKAVTGPAAAALISTKLIKLKHIKADGLPKLLPTTIPAANVKIVKEQNAILVVGTEELIQQAEGFIEQIDLVSPQIMIQALILELSESAARELGLKGGYFEPDTTILSFPEVQTYTTGKTINEVLDDIASRFKYESLGKLPTDFIVTLRALETRGDARVRANPKIATLNGNEAKIDVGWIRYYETRTGSPDNPIFQIHSIDAGIRLRIVPWVSASGEITTVIHTEVSNLIGISATGLPEVARRTADTTIRLMDGETVVIGGLRQSTKTETQERVPFLGSIPFLGRIFSKTSERTEESELAIYITPCILEEGGVEIED